MERHIIIKEIGEEFIETNIESGEFSYPKALSSIGKKIDDSLVSTGSTVHKNLDLRFVKDNISILIETKANFDKGKKLSKTYSQIQAYVNYEKVLTGNKIIAILANTEDNRIKVWWGSNLTIDDSHWLKKQFSIKSFDEYAELYIKTVNNKEKVIKSTYDLNELLHKYGISEKIRSQLVGTCLLSLKKDVKFEGLSTKQIIVGVEEVISGLLNNDLNRAKKLTILKTKVLESQDVLGLKKEELQEIIRHIKDEILPFVNDKDATGQDILNLFFTTFNKYVGKADKNQAFTPDHIVSLMCQVVGVNRNSKILDPCCGSGAFLVRAMTVATDDCSNKKEIQKVKKNNIHGIEFEETAFGLATTNMLIHSDGNSNVRQGSCFDLKDFIKDANINVVLMNPPYNAQRKHSLPSYVKNWPKASKQDPSKGFHFVKYVADIVKSGKMAVLLPMQCAIGTTGDIGKFKEYMLAEHTLDAVFSLPVDVFHPGANAVCCCMVFDLGIRHKKSKNDTFFGFFKDDGFVKKKNLGRVEKTKPNSMEGVWADIESKWLNLYNQRISHAGLSVVKKVDHHDEWLAEAYMDTDYSNVSMVDFEKTVREYVSFTIKAGLFSKTKVTLKKPTLSKITTNQWKEFYVGDLFSIQSTKGTTTDELIDGSDVPYIAAKKSSNGLDRMCDRHKNIDFMSKGNCIVFIQLGQGSAGYSLYQEGDFIGMSGKTSCGYNKNLNKYNGLFFVALLDLERPKFSYGRSWTGDRLLKTKIKLPTVGTENNTYKPDWDFMESYIKSMPYGDFI
jgi:type I restriction-modification system DNA methylase subunit